jgi:hypothetical protein
MTAFYLENAKRVTSQRVDVGKACARQVHYGG